MNAGTKKLADRDNEQEPDDQDSRAMARPDHCSVHACARIASQHFRLAPRAVDFQTDRKTRAHNGVQAHSFREIESSAPTAGRQRKERSFNRGFTLGMKVFELGGWRLIPFNNCAPKLHRLTSCRRTFSGRMAISRRSTYRIARGRSLAVAPRAERCRAPRESC